MSRETQFADEVLREFGPNKAFEPCAYYDESGDCIEFLFSNEPFFARRLDRWVTVYYAEATEQILGGLIKDITKLKLRFPGLDLEIEDGKVQIAFILRAPAWSTDDSVAKKTYKAAIKRAEESRISAQLQPA